MEPATLLPKLLELSINLPPGLIAIAVVMTSVSRHLEQIGFTYPRNRSAYGSRCYVQQLAKGIARWITSTGPSVVVIEDSQGDTLIGAAQSFRKANCLHREGDVELLWWHFMIQLVAAAQPHEQDQARQRR
jgi:hypothetical protein